MEAYGNPEPSRRDSEGATTIPQGSRSQERSKRPLSLRDKDIVWPVWKHTESIWNRYARNISGKYAVASTHLEDQLGWNESSRRYVTEVPEFYIPDVDQWRSAPENRKQGSGPVLPEGIGASFTADLINQAESGNALYEKAMNAGIAPEQARLFLPAYALYVRWRWTASLGAVVHFLHQRLASDAQSEIVDYAQVVRDLLGEHFPVTVGAIFE